MTHRVVWEMLALGLQRTIRLNLSVRAMLDWSMDGAIQKLNRYSFLKVEHEYKAKRQSICGSVARRICGGRHASWAIFISQGCKGSIAVVYCASASVILAVVALAVTLGDASIIRSRTQDALDSAVLAAASMGYGTTDADRIAFAQKLYDGRRSERGDGALQIVVRNLPPGTFKTSDTMVFGDVQLAMNSPFLGALDMPIIDIGVSSAARKSRSGVPVCVLGLDPTESATMDFNGQASLTVDNCATQANSTDGEGLHQVGHPSMSAKEIGVTGGFTGSAYAPAPITGTTPLPDPYASLTEPPSGPCHSMSGAKLQQQTLTLTPGTYCGGLDIKAGSIITLDPGIYIFQDGPLNIDSQSTVQGSEPGVAHGRADGPMTDAPR